MMRVFCLMLLAVSLVACGDRGGDVNQPSTESVDKVSSSGSVQSGADLGTACEAVDTDIVAEIMGWNSDKTVTSEFLNRKEGRLTVCHYLEEGGVLQVMLRISQESEKAQDNKALEKLYNNVMANGQKNISYEKLPTILGSETLYGTGEGMHGYTNHILRSRYGNETDVTIEVSTDQSDAATLKSQLIAIAKAMR